jgi:hypothetical protein
MLGPLSMSSRVHKGVKHYKWNWLLWTGFVICLLAYSSYFRVFVRFSLTRDFPWVNSLLFALSLAFLVAFRDSSQYDGKIVGPILIPLEFFTTTVDVATVSRSA